jgi:phasin
MIYVQCDGKEAKMAGPTINDFLPPELRAFAEQSVQQAKHAFDELMAATQRAVTTFEGHASVAQNNAREIQRKVIGFSERNVATSLEFAQKLLTAKDPEALMALHAEYVKGQMQALTEQAREIAQHATKAASPPDKSA